MFVCDLIFIFVCAILAKVLRKVNLTISILGYLGKYIVDYNANMTSISLDTLKYHSFGIHIKLC